MPVESRFAANSITVLLRTNPFPPLAPPSTLAQVANTLTHTKEHYQDFVTNAYQTYLGRPPASTALNSWVTQMQGGLSDEHLEAKLIGSTEYINNHGGPGAPWVQAMYQDLLGRAPSQTEVNNWVTALNNGQTAEQVAYSIATSPEREGIRVRADYQTFLGRTPTQTEVNGWVKQFATGLTNETLVAGFLASQEYFDGSTRGKNDKRDWVLSAINDVFKRLARTSEFTTWGGALQ